MKPIENSSFFALVADELRAGRQVRIRVKGTSMYPFLRSGQDEVELIPRNGARLQRGDILLFAHHGRYILHRYKQPVTHHGITAYKMQGDNVPSRYELCHDEEVIGIVTGVYRKRANGYLRHSPHSRSWQAVATVRRFLMRIIGYLQKIRQ